MKLSVYPFCLSLLLLFKVDIATAQEYQYIDLKVRANTEMPLREFYKDVVVLDNRNDSIALYITEDGNLPLTVFTFKENTASAIRNYIKARTEHLKKDSKTLLINILELRVPNKSTMRTLSARSNRNGWERIRNYIFFSAEVYESSVEGTYRKLFSVKRKRYRFTYIKETVKEIVDDLAEISEQILMNSQDGKSRIRKVYKEFQADSLSFTESQSEEQIPFESINRSKADQWKNIPIFKDESSAAAATYPLFEDFKFGLSFPAQLEKSYDNVDSIYKIKVIPKDTLSRPQEPYAVRDSAGYYIRLHKNYYIKLNRENYRFSFSIPGTMQDMYQILSIENVKSKNTFHSTVVSPLAPDLDLVVDAVLNLFEVFSKERKLNKLKSKSYSPLYRTCYIDMDSGDFIY
jgi:hypothetical protein